MFSVMELLISLPSHRNIHYTLEQNSLPYCAIADVKTILTESGTSFDAEIDGCIPSASGLVDAFLKREGLTVPISVPQNVKDACAHFAAWLFRRRRDPAGAEAFLAEADRFLDAYIAAEKEPYVGSA